MSAAEQYPRVLLLSNEAPHTGSAGAIVLYRLFRDYPKDRLLVVTNSRIPENARRLECRYEYIPIFADKLSSTRFWLWRPKLRALGASSIGSLGRIENQLAGFNPDAVVTLMQDSWYYDLAARYAAACRLPLTLLAHDVAHGFEPVPHWLKERQLLRDAAIYRQSSARLCISAGMVKYYEELFGIGGEVLLPPSSDAPVFQSPEACRVLKNHGRLTLGYAGGLHYGYGEQLIRLLPVLRETGTHLELFGPRPSGVLSSLNEATDVLHFNGFAATPEEAWRSLLDNCDAIIQPYLDPAGPHELQYRTHFPSKLGDCLGLGLPLLLTGPGYASGVAWCGHRPGIALWAGVESGTSIAQALQRLRVDADFRMNLAARAQVACGEFLPAPLRRRLMESIVRTVTLSVSAPTVPALA